MNICSVCEQPAIADDLNDLGQCSVCVVILKLQDTLARNGTLLSEETPERMDSVLPPSDRE